jgi:general secretion pathway protein G
METITEVKTTKRDKGFTLVELLIVIVILGVLATVTVFAVRGISGRGESTACKTDLRTVQVATEAHFAEKGTYPANTGALVTAGFLNSAPTRVYTISATGGVTPTVACAT